MKYIDEYRDRDLVLKLVEEIKKQSNRKISLMEVCGGHTMAIQKFGIPHFYRKIFNFYQGRDARFVYRAGNLSTTPLRCQNYQIPLSPLLVTLSGFPGRHPALIARSQKVQMSELSIPFWKLFK